MEYTIADSSNNANRPKVLIVGAGLAGLALGMILQKSDTPYEIIERAPKLRPSVGIWDELRSLSREVSVIHVVTAPELETAFLVPAAENAAKRYGAEARLLDRPTLYDLLMRQVPKHRLHLGKKVTTTEQGPNGVVVRCADGFEFKGDILVEADGAYSAVRQNLYAQLKDESQLPESDGLPLPFTSICLVGQTRPLNMSQFPDLAKTESQFKCILSKDKPYAWATFITEQNTVCFICTKFLSEESSKEDDSFNNSEWGPEAAQTMCNEIRDFPIIGGGEKQLTLGDLFDWTPKELISKVMLEEKVFQTWSHGRTVLMGDACHKFNPSGGEGGNNSLHDAVVLANYIHALPDKPTVDEIKTAFATYKQERISWVEGAFSSSQAFKSMVDAGWKAAFVRFLMKNMPKWVNGIIERGLLSNRPQIYFLPPDETPTVMLPAPQASLLLKCPEQKHKTREGITRPL